MVSGGGNALPDDVLKNKTFTNGRGQQVGTLELTGDAEASSVLYGKTFYSNNAKSKLEGTMVNKGTWNVTINPGDSVTIPEGYHNGRGKVSANEVAPKAITASYSGNFDRGNTVTFNFSQWLTPKMIIVGGKTNQSDWDGDGPVVLNFAGNQYTVLSERLTKGQDKSFCTIIYPSGSGDSLTIRNDYRSIGANCNVAVIY